jgi:4-hydroxy-2-oxoheptanedioate aldolase
VTLKQKLRGGTLIGTFAAIPHPVATEVLARTNLDLLCIDWEHAQLDRERMQEMVRAADVHRMAVMVRVPTHGAEYIAAALDAGASGVLVPRIGDIAQAEAAVAAGRFPPEGTRGVGPGRASGYGSEIGSYLAGANERTLVALQIETAEGARNAAGIAAVPGVDLIFIGPADLAASLGATAPSDRERLTAAIESIIVSARAAGIATGIFASAAQEVAHWAARGVRVFMIGNDTLALASAVNAHAAVLREAALRAPSPPGA